MSLAQMRMRNIQRPILYFFNIFFFAVFIFVPLIVESMGGAQTVRWGQSQLINDADTMMIYAAYVICYSFVTFALVMSAQKVPSQQADETVVSFSKKRHRQYGMILILLATLGLAAFVLGSGLSLAQLFVASRFGWFGSEGSNGLIVLLGLYLMSTIAPATYNLFAAGRVSIVQLVAILVVVGLVIALTGGRKWVIFSLSGYIACRYFHKGNLKVHFMDTALIGGLIFFVVVWQFGRHLTEVTSESILQIVVERGRELFVDGDISYFYRASLEAISINIHEGIIHQLNVVGRLLFIGVPSELTFGLKPEALPVAFALDIGAVNSVRVGNMPPSVIGIFVLSFGSIPGIPLFAAIVPILLVKIDEYFRRRTMFRDALSSYVIVVLIFIARGNIGALKYLIFFAAVFLVITMFLSFFRWALQGSPKVTE